MAEIISKVNKTLNAPLPMGTGWRYALLPGIIVFLLLFILSPFNFDQLDTLDRLVKSTIFGMITSCSVIIHFFFGELLLPSVYSEDKWTVKFEIVTSSFDILLVGLWNTLFLKVFELAEVPFWWLLWKIQTHTFLIAIFPMIAIALLKYNETLKAQVKRVHEFNTVLLNQRHADQQTTIVLTDENGKPELNLHPGEIKLLKSDGNYIDVYYGSGEVLQKHLLRNRMKNVMDQLPQDTFFHCHKSYVVNLRSIKEVKGNARDLRVSITGLTQSIPVSRSKTSALMATLKAA
ncbi:MAG: LytTR family DNA-binding domain-containing protein [Cyclobacteriaceae bacterium]